MCEKHGAGRLIQQGDLYWLQLKDSNHRHPYVVLQEDVLNHSRIATTVVCALTTNRKQANEPGNVLLEVGESGLDKQSIVLVSKVSTVFKEELKEYIGTLSSRRVEQIFAGMRFQQRSFFR